MDVSTGNYIRMFLARITSHAIVRATFPAARVIPVTGNAKKTPAALVSFRSVSEVCGTPEWEYSHFHARPAKDVPPPDVQTRQKPCASIPAPTEASSPLNKKMDMSDTPANMNATAIIRTVYAKPAKFGAKKTPTA